MNYKKHNTTKLFYNKYVNKITVISKCAYLLRGGNVPYITKQMSIIGVLLKDRHTVSEIAFVNDLLSILQRYENEYLLRVEVNRLSIYSNNDMLIKEVHGLSSEIYEVSKPVSNDIRNYLLNTKNKILVKQCDFKYKVTLKSYNNEFYNWVNTLPHKFKSNVCSGIVHVLDEKSLNLCKLFLGNNIRRIEEYILETDI